MDLSLLTDLPPWEWPRTAQRDLKDALRDNSLSPTERALAAELAGDLVVIDDEIASLLLGVLADPNESEPVRANAAIALGPVLEQSDIDGFEEDPYSEPPITEATFKHIKQTFEELYYAPDVPKEVRRRILEAAVRADDDWHADAIRTASAEGDHEWLLTAVFCMQYVRGFEKDILQALTSDHADIKLEAIRAAGTREIEEAWPIVREVLLRNDSGKDALIAALGAAANLCPPDETDVLYDLSDSEDEDVAEAADEALSMAEMSDGDEEDEEDEEEDDDDLFDQEDDELDDEFDEDEADDDEEEDNEEEDKKDFGDNGRPGSTPRR